MIREFSIRHGLRSSTSHSNTLNQGPLLLEKDWCRICSSDTQKFEEAYSSENKRLAIHTREGASQHWGAKLFLRGEYAAHELGMLADRHPDDTDLRNLMLRLRTRRSAKEADGCSLTLTQGSAFVPGSCSAQPARQRSRTWLKSSSNNLNLQR